MLFILLLLFFLQPLEILAETVETPYYKVATSIDQTREKIMYQKRYLLEEAESKITDGYYLFTEAPEDYPIKTSQFIKTNWSPYQLEYFDLPDYEWETRTIVFYQLLKKIPTLYLKDIKNLFILDIRVNDKTVFSKPRFTLSFKKKVVFSVFNQRPDNVAIEIDCYLMQDDKNGKFVLTDESRKYIYNEFEVVKKGISTIKIKLIDCLKRMEVDEKVYCDLDYQVPFYTKILKTEKQYRYRQLKYRYQKKKQRIWSFEKKRGYHVLKEEEYPQILRKEKIVFYDEINLNNYLDLDKIVKSATFPLKYLKISKEGDCGIVKLHFKYKDFTYEKTANFNCISYKESMTKKYYKTSKLKKLTFLFSFFSYFANKF